MVTNDFPGRANHELDSELANIVSIDISHVRDLSPILSSDKKHRVTTSVKYKVGCALGNFQSLSTNPLKLAKWALKTGDHA